MTALVIRNLPLLCRLLHCPSGGGSDDSLAEAYQVLRTLSGKRRISQLCFASCGCCKLSHQSDGHSPRKLLANISCYFLVQHADRLSSYRSP